MHIFIGAFVYRVTGLHSNMCSSFGPSTFFWSVVGTYIPSLVLEKEHYSKYYPISNTMKLLIEESGYFHIQATKPDTIGKFVFLIKHRMLIM